MKRKIFIVIPALNPSNELTKLVEKLVKLLDVSVIVVNDGSKCKYDNIFNSIRKFENVFTLNHKTNKGKGSALKTAFKFILKNDQKEEAIIVTADADGQHAVSDIEKVLSFAKTLNEKFLILGVRDLSKNIPFRSKIGNFFIDKAFKIFHGIDCKGDSQTGLRAFSSDLLRKFSTLEGNKYEFETNMLLSIKNGEANLRLVPIKTIYIDHNQSSHFRPVIDSLKIIKQLFSYSLVAISTFFLEIFIFAVLLSVFTIIQANFLARVCSIAINFILVKSHVFESKERTIITAPKFVAVALINSLLVGVLASLVSSALKVDNIFILKIFFDSCLFFINFYISKRFIFKDKS